MIQIYGNNGLVFKNNNYRIIKKTIRKGESINKHNHPEAEIIFTLVKGILLVSVDEQNNYLEVGECLHFDGNHYISAEAVQDSEIFIILINKEI